MTDDPVLTIEPLPDCLTNPALNTVLQTLPTARLVGGVVRDTLLGRAVADIDLASPLPPDAVIAALRGAGIRVVPTGMDHGTVTAIVDGHGFEITTLRRDVETDGRHAVVAFTTDWRTDASRRDFTINAMSMTRDGAVYDYFGGVDDLNTGIVRFVGDAATRIAEDYLRILRFFRFFARYGRVGPDAATLAAIHGGVPGLHRLSVERVWSELSKILAAPDPRRAIALMETVGVIAAVVPEGAEPGRLVRLIDVGAPLDVILRMSALLTGDPVAFAERLKLSGLERDRLVALRHVPVPAPDADDAALRRALADNEGGVLVGRSWLLGGASAEWTSLRDRMAAMPRPVFPLSGRDVVAAGQPPGPTVGMVLRHVRGWWLRRGCVDDLASCREELLRCLREGDASASGAAAIT